MDFLDLPFDILAFHSDFSDVPIDVLAFPVGVIDFLRSITRVVTSHNRNKLREFCVVHGSQGKCAAPFYFTPDRSRHAVALTTYSYDRLVYPKSNVEAGVYFTRDRSRVK